MASAKGYSMSRRPENYSFLSSGPIQDPTSEFEFDESDVWGGSIRSESPEWRQSPLSSRRRNGAVGGGGGLSEARSVPVNIPNWSKILREEYRKGERIGSDDFDDVNNNKEDVSGGDLIGEMMAMPPHEHLATTRMTSMSVHEGIGRTLKGRDLRRVRNAIWEKTGFQD